MVIDADGWMQSGAAARPGSYCPQNCVTVIKHHITVSGIAISLEIIPEIEKNGLSATVYTELTDIEDEQNGIFTFDRTLKIKKQTLIDINKKVENAYAKKFK